APRADRALPRRPPHRGCSPGHRPDARAPAHGHHAARAPGAGNRQLAARTRGAVKAVTAEASGRRLSSGRHDADIVGMRAAILLVALALPLGASASTSSRVGVRVVVLPT